MQFVKKIFSPLIGTVKFIQENFKAMLFLLLLALIFAPQSKEDLKPNNLEEIALVGPIMDSNEIVNAIDEAAQNKLIRGILINIDSPGGAVAPSIEIAYAVKRARELKPVVAYAGGTLASGSYYAAIWANEIIANPGSMVGSIGVVMQGADLSGLMSKIGIKSQSVQAGEYKKVGTMDREWTPKETQELNKVIQSTYDLFTGDVAEARGLDINKRDDYANAHIFTSSQAKEVGLIDTVGVKYDAKQRVQELSGVDEALWNKEDRFEKLMKKLTSQTAVLLHTYFPELSLR